MFDVGADIQFKIYNKARSHLIKHPDILIKLEEYLSYKLHEIISYNITEIKEDYDEASLLYPFWKQQPLLRIGLATIPNGLLLTKNPGYLNKYPGLLFPGKDDKTKNPLKVRARIDFGILEKIDPWRYQEILS